jgi:hypothetical protein
LTRSGAGFFAFVARAKAACGFLAGAALFAAVFFAEAFFAVAFFDDLRFVVMISISCCKAR